MQNSFWIHLSIKIICAKMIFGILLNALVKMLNKKYFTKNCSNKMYSKKIYKKKLTCKIKKLCILLAFLLITITLGFILLQKISSKKKHLLPYHYTSIKLKEIGVKNIL